MKKCLSIFTISVAVCLCAFMNMQNAEAKNNNYSSNDNSLQAVARISNPNEPYRQQVLNTIQAQIENVYTQYNINMYDLVKIHRLNKYQKNAFVNATEMYRSSLFYAMQNLEFYKEDLALMNLDNYDDREGNRRITEIQMKTNAEYNNLVMHTNNYLRTCTFRDMLRNLNVIMY